MNNIQLIHKIRRLKGIDNNAAEFKIRIQNNNFDEIGSLHLINTQISLQKSTQESLTKWRKMFKRYFLTQFKPSIERTADWLKNTVLPSDDRLLFLICDNSGIPIGNFGVCNITQESVELDNLIRGEKGGDKDLVFFSELAILKWIYNELDIPLAVLHVFSNNYKTIALHQRVGFSITEKKPLRKITTEDGIRFSYHERTGEEVNFKYVTMELLKKDFPLLTR